MHGLRLIKVLNMVDLKNPLDKSNVRHWPTNKKKHHTSKTPFINIMTRMMQDLILIEVLNVVDLKNPLDKSNVRHWPLTIIETLIRR